MTGFRHPKGELTVISYSHPDYHGWAVWDCVCDCGNRCKVAGCSIRSGATRSCGCLRTRALKARSLQCVAWGESKTLADWVKDSRCAVSMSVLRERLKRGWSAEKSLSEPLMQRHLSPKEEQKAIVPSGRGIPLKELIKICH
jgi:hypothetical protein